MKKQLLLPRLIGSDEKKRLAEIPLKGNIFQGIYCLVRGTGDS